MKNNKWLTPNLVLLLVCAGVNSADAQSSRPRFPIAAAADVGISADAIRLLEKTAEGLVASDSVVGVELHVIKNRKTVSHKAYGWADREAKRPLKTNSIYCVRSMTKPLTGTAIQMLIDEGKLSLDQKASEFIEEFDTEATRDITISHLLSHTGGFRFSSISRPLSEYKSLRDVAAEAVEAGVTFPPGTKFQYSDSGSDTLGAIIEIVTGKTAGEFVEERMLKPLEMSDSMVLLGENNPRVARIPTAYSGGARSWQPHWRNSDAPIFPIYLTSQSLYSTTSDYARFLTLWMDGGKLGERSLLSEDAIRRALAPGKPVAAFRGAFKNLTASYGHQWVVRHHKEEGEKLVIFGHDGSDGTHAWVWPEQDLIVLLFTQSRGTLVGPQFEAAADRLLVKGDVDAYQEELLAAAAAKRVLKRCEGLYWDENRDSAYYVISSEKGDLVLERPGRTRIVARATKKLGEFSMLGATLKFELDGETDPAKAMVMSSFNGSERQVRHTPPSGLPTVDELLKKVRAAHQFQRIEKAGVVKLSGTMTMGILGRKGKIRQWIDGRRSRTELEIGGATQVVITTGDKASATDMSGSAKPLTGVSLDQALVGHPVVHFGGWRDGYRQLEVLKQIEREGRKLIMVRAVPKHAPGSTIVVDAESGQVVAEQRIEFLPGAGYIGQEGSYGDFRDVAGMSVPFRYRAKYASPFIGTIEIQFDEVETGLEAGELFELK